MPIEHVHLIWFMLSMSPRLCHLFWRLVQSMLQLQLRSPGPYEWTMPIHMRSGPVLRLYIFYLSILRFKLLQLFRVRSHSVVPGLGICLSDLVQTTTSGSAAIPTITGINSPATSTTSSSHLAWWEIMLMALGCAFIFLVIVVTWRNRMRRKRAQATAAFATAKRLNPSRSWRWRIARFGERLFGRAPRQRWTPPEDMEEVKLDKLRAAEEARHDRALEKRDEYEYGSRHEPSPLPSLYDYYTDSHGQAKQHGDRHSAVSLSQGSLYTPITGVPRRAPEPRQPTRNPRDLLPSRFSDTTLGSHDARERERASARTPAQEYAWSVTQAQDMPRGSYWLKPTSTGSTNPFRR
ncbi:uncharacterized protein FIBRA_06710 [Fibroporia radiculosa]|uniref:Uncharacterized protein n=1 Tax=Fibroporia radiculosa TaxID=599839 RepID=J4H480_9APHY|nr:uncharacterized protein FIBRA_06710 [Fibroporia radiculosa]CCM04529.1 predicted protein [Fibroporia radiculosa]